MKNKFFIPFLVSFILLLSVIVLNQLALDKLRNYTVENIRSRNIIISITELAIDLKSAEVFTNSYLTLPVASYYRNLQKNVNEINPDLNRIRVLAKNDLLKRQIDSLERMINEQLPYLRSNNLSELIDSGQAFRLESLSDVHNLINRTIESEKKLLAQKTIDLENNLRSFTLLIILLSILAVVIVLLTFLSQSFTFRRNLWLEGFIASIVNTSQDGIMYFRKLKKKDFRIEFINKTGEQILADGNELTGKRFSELHLDILSSQFLQHSFTVMETGNPAQFEVAIRNNDSRKWLLISLSKLRQGVTCNFHDITNIKRYEQELKHKIVELERSNEELEQYAFAASHDLQEPLRKIKTFGSFLQETQAYKLDEAGQQQLSKLLLATDRMTIVIKDLLSFSGLQKEQSFLPTDLDQVLKNVLGDLEMLIMQKNATVNAGHLPTIEAIPLQMNQLFYNIIINCLKFSRQGVPPVIEISCSSLNQEQKNSIPALQSNLQYIEINIKDNGIGFNNVYAERIFGLFKRLHDRGSYEGSGIGLALCKKVVENHKGFIRAEGVDGEGSQFSIYLPTTQQIA